MKKKLPAFTFRTLINKYGHYIKYTLGMDEIAITADFEEYQSKQPDASIRDYMWSVFNRIILKGGSSDTYREMGRFVVTYEGKNGNQYHRIALKQQFEGLANQTDGVGIKMGISLIGNVSCSHSMKFDKVYDFSDFSDGIPLASEECSLLSCTCSYSSTALRDKNKHLIFLD